MRVSTKAGKGDTRSNNLRLVLQHFFSGDQRSCADVARLSGLTPATVSGLVSQLVDMGLVEEVGPRRINNRVGKPPTMLRIRSDARNVVAVDLSEPATMRAAVVDLAAEIVQEVVIETGHCTGDRAITMVKEIVTQAVDNTTAPILGIGVGTPGLVVHGREIVEASNFEWRDVALADAIEEAVGYPTYISNDAQAAAIAEYTRGNHDRASLVVVRIGSGVGAGLIVDHRLLTGDSASAGEIGHLVVDEKGHICGCGHRGCLETFVSIPSIRRQIEGGIGRREVLETAAQRFGAVMAAIASVLDLHLVLVAGPKEQLGDSFCEMAAESLRNRCLDQIAELVEVRWTSLGDEIVLLGAAGVVISEELGVA